MARRCRHKPCKAPLPKVKDCESLIHREGYCCTDCKIQYALEAGRRLLAKRKAQEDRAHREQKRETKERLKTRRDWMREAQQAFNRYVRARDYGKPCASCGAMPSQKMGGTMDCSHYRSVGSAPHLRFFLWNAAAACVRCNRELSGNVVALRAGLIERFGLARVEAVEADQTPRKFDVEYLKRLKSIFRRKAARLEKRRELQQRAA